MQYMAHTIAMTIWHQGLEDLADFVTQLLHFLLLDKVTCII
jgi:hypothetical protein